MGTFTMRQLFLCQNEYEYPIKRTIKGNSLVTTINHYTNQHSINNTDCKYSLSFQRNLEGTLYVVPLYSNVHVTTIS